MPKKKKTPAKRAKPKKTAKVSAPPSDAEWDALQDRYDTVSHDWAGLAELVK
jgi:hypothetical protein